jgi:hypothetical protein
MNWIDDKLVSERERNRPKPDELSPDTVHRQKKRNLALATGTSKRLIVRTSPASGSQVGLRVVFG